MTSKNKSTAAVHQVIAKYSTDGIFSQTSELIRIFTPLKGRIIGVEGTIGVGKTTFGHDLVAELNRIGISAIFLEENYDPSLLKLFCDGLKCDNVSEQSSEQIGQSLEQSPQKTGQNPQNPQKNSKEKKNYSFSFQLDMLNACQQNYREAEWHAGRHGGISNKVVIIDRTVWGNAVFAAIQFETGNITEEEMNVYYSRIKRYSPYRFDHIIYLDISPEKALERITERDRDAESAYTLEYLESLEKAYYSQIYSQMTANQSNIIVISNERYCNALTVMRKVLAREFSATNNESFTFPPEIIPPGSNAVTDRSLTPNDIRKAFELLCQFYRS